ncbi:MAG: hypothetical protein JHD15_19415 [Phenylobacterium sp.]|uniref:hypothetical protein n=1 Tax=Phenylobacterium sp. TaxID=1871053 RepID=UPI001A2D5FFC|nr:hypothetical protein [Phenylobacterium sp.]MBJ7412508.1 hypothetical protein [Phenylobacterium sp.]
MSDPDALKLARGLDLTRDRDRSTFRDRVDLELQELRVAEVHALAERLTGRSWGLQRHARAAIADTLLIVGRDAQQWIGVPCQVHSMRTDAPQ